MAFKDYVLDSKEKKIRGPFLSVIITAWLLVFNTLPWFPFISDAIVERASAYLIGFNATGLTLIGMYWFNRFKQKQLDEYVDFAKKSNGFKK